MAVQAQLVFVDGPYGFQRVSVVAVEACEPRLVLPAHHKRRKHKIFVSHFAVWVIYSILHGKYRAEIVVKIASGLKFFVFELFSARMAYSTGVHSLRGRRPFGKLEKLRMFAVIRKGIVALQA